MTKLCFLLLSLPTFAVVPSHALVANSIQFATGSPSVCGGAIEACGNFQIDGSATLKGITLFAVRDGGGEGGEAACCVCGSSWDGSIGGLAAGKYSVYARLHVTVDSISEYYDTELACVTIP